MRRQLSISSNPVMPQTGSRRAKVRTGSRQGADRVGTKCGSGRALWRTESSPWMDSVAPVHGVTQAVARVRDGLILRVVRRGGRRTSSHGARNS